MDFLLSYDLKNASDDDHAKLLNALTNVRAGGWQRCDTTQAVKVRRLPNTTLVRRNVSQPLSTVAVNFKRIASELGLTVRTFVIVVVQDSHFESMIPCPDE